MTGTRPAPKPVRRMSDVELIAFLTSTNSSYQSAIWSSNYDGRRIATLRQRLSRAQVELTRRGLETPALELGGRVDA